MPYTPTVWQDNVTLGNQTRMNNLETAYTEAVNSFEQDLFTPFVLSGCVASKDGTTATQLDVTAGVAVLKQSDNTLRRRAPSSTTFTTVTINTTYYLFLNNDGTYTWSTTSTPPSNSLAICTVTTDGSGNIKTVADARVMTTGLFGAGEFAPVLASASVASSVTPSQTATVIGAVTFGGAAALSGDSSAGSATFTGATGYIACPTSGLPTGNSAFSMAVLFKFAANPASNTVLMGYGGTVAKSGFSLWIDSSGKLNADCVGSTGLITSASAVSTATWHLACVTWDGTTYRLYLDGASVGTPTTPGTLSLTTGALIIGSNSSAASYFWNGNLAEVAVFNATLSGAQITALNTAITAGGYTAAVFADSPLRYYRLGEPAGARYAGSSVPSTLTVVGTDGSNNLGRVASVAGQATAGAFGVPVIVAQLVNQPITSTSQYTFTYTAPPNGLYRVTPTFRTAISGAKITLQVGWVDDAGNVNFADFSLSGSAHFAGLCNALVLSPGVGSYACEPLLIYAVSTGGHNIVVNYTNATATPNDLLSVIIERLS